jgi:hypothetical protein
MWHVPSSLYKIPAYWPATLLRSSPLFSYGILFQVLLRLSPDEYPVSDGAENCHCSLVQSFSIGEIYMIQIDYVYLFRA